MRAIRGNSSVTTFTCIFISEGRVLSGLFPSILPMQYDHMVFFYPSASCFPPFPHSFPSLVLSSLSLSPSQSHMTQIDQGQKKMEKDLKCIGHTHTYTPLSHPYLALLYLLPSPHQVILPQGMLGRLLVGPS